MNPQEITRFRTAILLSLLPNVAIATYPATIAREMRRNHGIANAAETNVLEHLNVLKTTGLVDLVAADHGLTTADRGWKLTERGVQAAELSAYS